MNRILFGLEVVCVLSSLGLALFALFLASKAFTVTMFVAPVVCLVSSFLLLITGFAMIGKSESADC